MTSFTAFVAALFTARTYIGTGTSIWYLKIRTKNLILAMFLFLTGVCNFFYLSCCVAVVKEKEKPWCVDVLLIVQLLPQIYCKKRQRTRKLGQSEKSPQKSSTLSRWLRKSSRWPQIKCCGMESSTTDLPTTSDKKNTLSNKWSPRN